MPITITNDAQCEDARNQIAELEHLPRTEERAWEISVLTHSVNAWRMSQAKPDQPLGKEGYDQAVERIHELTGSPQGSQEAIELSGLIDAVADYEEEQVLRPSTGSDEGAEANPLERSKPNDVT